MAYPTVKLVPPTNKWEPWRITLRPTVIGIVPATEGQTSEPTKEQIAHALPNALRALRQLIEDAEADLVCQRCGSQSAAYCGCAPYYQQAPESPWGDIQEWTESDFAQMDGDS